MEITLFYITNKDKDAADALANLALEKRVAGCANIFSSHSFFPWEKKLHEEDEYVLILKTLPVLKDELRMFIAKHHPYEIPCIISWNVDVNESYGSWIQENINQDLPGVD